MAITRQFKETIQARALRDPEFRVGLLKESIESMLAGDTETGKMILRDYTNATIGFKKLGAVTHKSPKSLMRMFSPSGNPTAKNLFDILHTLQKKEGVQLEVQTLRQTSICF
ncbi:MAG: transcriptional regulator [Nitrospina sp.]|nr:MAG: transcriptional regulator [Nitrospina sp.]